MNKQQWATRLLDYRKLLRQTSAGSADLVLTDPPYAISRPTGFTRGGVKRLGVDMEFGDWDRSPISIDRLCALSFDALRKGGTIIVFYDLWKITHLADALRAAGFDKLRFIEWIKTNPVPLNSRTTYLSNAREIAVCAAKGTKPTFNSQYDGGAYATDTFLHGIPKGKERFHPTQKPLELFQELVRRHSNEGDLVIDPFMGSGTTGVAAVGEGRRFLGGDIDREYLNKARRRLRNVKSQKNLR